VNTSATCGFHRNTDEEEELPQIADAPAKRTGALRLMSSLRVYDGRESGQSKNGLSVPDGTMAVRGDLLGACGGRQMAACAPV